MKCDICNTLIADPETPTARLSINIHNKYKYFRPKAQKKSCTLTGLKPFFAAIRKYNLSFHCRFLSRYKIFSFIPLMNP